MTGSNFTQIKVGNVASDCEILKLVGKENVQIGVNNNGAFRHLSICYDCNKLKINTCESLELKASSDIIIKPDYDYVISLQNNTEVPCGHDLTFLTTNSQINFADSSYIKTAGKTQNYINDDDYTLQLTDNGQTIFMNTNNTIYVPDTNAIYFPIGASITIISGYQDIVIARYNENVNLYGNEYGTYGGVSSLWIIPPFTTGILSLIDNNTWVLTAPNMRITAPP
jgi:hypothetical protein